VVQDALENDHADQQRAGRDLEERKDELSVQVVRAGRDEENGREQVLSRAHPPRADRAPRLQQKNF
jgi:hypothetical protein